MTGHRTRSGIMARPSPTAGRTADHSAPCPSVLAGADPSRQILSVDLVYRKHRYRIAEPNRENGASIGPAAQQAACGGCPKVLRDGSRCLRQPNGRQFCLACAISREILLHMTDCIEDDIADEAERARQIKAKPPVAPYAGIVARSRARERQG